MPARLVTGGAANSTLRRASSIFTSQQLFPYKAPRLFSDFGFALWFCAPPPALVPGSFSLAEPPQHPGQSLTKTSKLRESFPNLRWEGRADEGWQDEEGLIMARPAGKLMAQWNGGGADHKRL
mmetsp:Transcript_3297/g.7801  ORF Transcript_3297/g.7801 Transcript_3297/m.7801 type:complete len:123 (+) Transcript_3297:1658-2026(+)